MNPPAPRDKNEPPGVNRERRARRFVLVLQVFFLLVALPGLDSPFVSAHNERQNQTFDIARHVFHDGWSSVVTPRTSFSWPGHESERFAVYQQEVPFHGLLGWSLAEAFGHERAVVRLVTVAFALASIQLMYSVLRGWLQPVPAAAGAALWTSAPLVLHFGQVPMPDLLCTTGIMAAFLFAQRGKLPASSGWFLFAILAKANVLGFGLPVLVALLVSRSCRCPREFLRLSLLWGWAPLCGFAAWTSLEFFGPPSPNSMVQIIASRGGLGYLLDAHLYLYVAGCLLPFGAGVMGGLALALAWLKRSPGMHPAIKWAIVASNVFYLAYVLSKIPEPQYLLPPLFWTIVAASFGLQTLLAWLPARLAWRAALGGVLAAHLLLSASLTCDLKASRVPNVADVAAAGELTPADARVIVVYRFYGASPAVWLNRNVYAVNRLSELETALPKLRALGFGYVLLLDIESRHSAAEEGGLNVLFTRLFRTALGTTSQPANDMSNFAGPASPERQYCEARFSKLFERPHVVLYSLAAPTRPVQ